MIYAFIPETGQASLFMCTTLTIIRSNAPSSLRDWVEQEALYISSLHYTVMGQMTALFMCTFFEHL